ncbi:gluconokinase [Microbacterium immunditiarum]|uniref:gluconokinase n=1 Tax=Microbacterium immunditiarum TaxID=337480 RepID=UPI001FEAAFFC|nr:gluconokinase [Microbacterium immunditiarum]
MMGVSGSGKSTVGRVLADQLTVPFVDADDLHPASNIDKMRAGVPLTDSDREPWLDAVGSALAQLSAGVVACSALARRYRDRIRVFVPDASFVQLDGSRALLAARLADRRGHFMPTGLLDSQLATLEPLQHEEDGLLVDITASPAEIVKRVLEHRASGSGRNG